MAPKNYRPVGSVDLIVYNPVFFRRIPTVFGE